MEALVEMLPLAWLGRGELWPATHHGPRIRGRPQLGELVDLRERLDAVDSRRLGCWHTV